MRIPDGWSLEPTAMELEMQARAKERWAEGVERNPLAPLAVMLAGAALPAYIALDMFLTSLFGA